MKADGGLHCAFMSLRPGVNHVWNHVGGREEGGREDNAARSYRVYVRPQTPPHPADSRALNRTL